MLLWQQWLDVPERSGPHVRPDRSSSFVVVVVVLRRHKIKRRLAKRFSLCMSLVGSVVSAVIDFAVVSGTSFVFQSGGFLVG